MASNISPASRDVYFLITGTYFIVILASVIKLVRIRAEDQRKNQLLLQEKIETELKLLKSQIHPHFLFNTLNNLYALALKKSEHMPEMILKLSEMLDYLLYQSNDPSIPVRKELELIENYISLEKMRYGDRLEINLLSTGNLDKIEIPPLMIIPLIENAFKHGISKMRDKVWINILIKREKNLLNIQIENSKFNNGQISANQNFKGIGLKNLQRRLDLLFEDKYELDIIDQKDRFIVNLQLIISIDQHET